MSEHREFDDLMRRSLREEADRIEPTDALPEIRARAHSERRPASRRPWLLTAGAAAIGTAAAIGAFTVFTGDENSANDGETVAGPGTTTSAAPATRSDSPGPSPVPTAATLPRATTESKPTSAGPTDRGSPEQSVTGVAVPVYWLGNKAGASGRTSARLYRTWAKVSGRPALEAVRIMTSKQSADPDYYSYWRGASVNTVTRSQGVVTVDFKQLPKTTLDSELASMATQQLIYTIQGALQDSGQPVRITEHGRAADKLFGQIDTSTPIGRAQAADVQALVWINSPTEGQVASGTVTVQGTANAYESTVNYSATNLKTRETRQSFVNTKEGQKFSPFAFQLKLTPGPWRIEAFLTSAEDGSITDADSKAIVVK